MNTTTCDEWLALGADEARALNRAKISSRHIPGDILYLEGDPSRGVYRVESGMIGIRKTDADGNSFLLRVVNPGETLGYRALIAGEAHRTGAEMLEAGVVSFVGAGAFLSAFKKNTAFAGAVLKRMAKSLGDAEDKIFENATLPLRARLARFLVDLSARDTQGRPQTAVRLEIPFSRQTLASFLCTTPESVSRTIRRMEDDGVAEFSGRAVRVRDVAGLYHESGLGLAA